MELPEHYRESVEICNVESNEIQQVAVACGHASREILHDWEQKAEQDRLTMVSAKIGETIVGCVNILWDGADEQVVKDEIGTTPMINALGVNELYRKKHIASLLMDSCEKQVKQKTLNSSAIALGVEVDNLVARTMYERRGYQYRQVAGNDEFTTSWPEIDARGNKTIYYATCLLMVKHFI